MYCSKCGNKVKNGAAFCGYCGTKIEPMVMKAQNSTPVDQNAMFDGQNQMNEQTDGQNQMNEQTDSQVSMKEKGSVHSNSGVRFELLKEKNHMMAAIGGILILLSSFVPFMQFDASYWNKLFNIGLLTNGSAVPSYYFSNNVDYLLIFFGIVILALGIVVIWHAVTDNLKNAAYYSYGSLACGIIALIYANSAFEMGEDGLLSSLRRWFASNGEAIVPSVGFVLLVIGVVLCSVYRFKKND